MDEIGQLPISLQAKLLRAIEDGEFQRVGSPQSEKCKCLIVAATNKNLPAEIRAGRFLPDLYDRLRTFEIEMPSLSSDPDLIQKLAENKIKQIHNSLQSADYDPLTLSEAAMQLLRRYTFPGNVRDLDIILTRLFLLQPSNGQITAEMMSNELNRAPQIDRNEPLSRLDNNSFMSLFAAVVDEALSRYESTQEPPFRPTDGSAPQGFLDEFLKPLVYGRACRLNELGVDWSKIGGILEGIADSKSGKSNFANKRGEKGHRHAVPRERYNAALSNDPISPQHLEYWINEDNVAKYRDAPNQ